LAGNARTARVLLLTLIAIVPASRSNAASSDQPDRVSVYVGAASVQQESSDDAKKRASSLGDIRNALKKSDLLVAATDVEHAQVVIELQARDIVLHNPVTVVLKTVGLAGDSGRYTSGTWSHILRMVVRARGRTETLTGQYDQQGPSGPTVNWIDQPWSHAAAGAVRAIESWVETNYLQRAVLVRTDGVYVSTHRGDSELYRDAGEQYVNRLKQSLKSCNGASAEVDGYQVWCFHVDDFKVNRKKGQAQYLGRVTMGQRSADVKAIDFSGSEYWIEVEVQILKEGVQ
jgi:hypothetical protein